MEDKTYQIENPTAVTRNLSAILFNEEFSDVVITAGGQGGLPSE